MTLRCGLWGAGSDGGLSVVDGPRALVRLFFEIFLARSHGLGGPRQHLLCSDHVSDGGSTRANHALRLPFRLDLLMEDRPPNANPLSVLTRDQWC